MATRPARTCERSLGERLAGALTGPPPGRAQPRHAGQHDRDRGQRRDDRSTRSGSSMTDIATAPKAISADQKYMISTARRASARSPAAGGAGAACPARTATGRPGSGGARPAAGRRAAPRAPRAAAAAAGHRQRVAPAQSANVCESAVLDAVTADAASSSPISIEPESPMKIRAGLKLCGRKPRHAPASTAVSSVGARGVAVCPAGPGGRRRRRTPAPRSPTRRRPARRGRRRS